MVTFTSPVLLICLQGLLKPLVGFVDGAGRLATVVTRISMFVGVVAGAVLVLLMIWHMLGVLKLI